MTHHGAPHHVTVDLPGRPYDVVVGRGVLDQVGGVVATTTRARRVRLVTLRGGHRRIRRRPRHTQQHAVTQRR